MYQCVCVYIYIFSHVINIETCKCNICLQDFCIVYICINSMSNDVNNNSNRGVAGGGVVVVAALDCLTTVLQFPVSQYRYGHNCVCTYTD